MSAFLEKKVIQHFTKRLTRRKIQNNFYEFFENKGERSLNAQVHCREFYGKLLKIFFKDIKKLRHI